MSPTSSLIALHCLLTLCFCYSFIGWAVTNLGGAKWYLNTQNPTYATPTPNPNSLILTRQFGNTLLVSTLLGATCLYSTASNPTIGKAYLMALAIGDLGHVVTTARVLGWQRTKAVRKWNLMMWANFGFTGFLFINRMLFLSGVTA